tara:strand:+ start:1727 stop:2173 length:447 start_codon:yes stop_codon:yes gene_type:complete
MTSKDTRYLKGTLTTDNQRKDLLVDDGRLTHGFIIKSFTMWPARSGQVGDFSAVLATKSSGAALPMNASDNRQIGWAYCPYATSLGSAIESIILPDEIVLEELIIVADWTGTDFADGLNYLIELCPITITDSHSALVLINNKSQDLQN